MMDGHLSQLSSDIRNIVAKTVQYKAELKSIKGVDPQSGGTVAVRESHPIQPHIVFNVQYNIANSPIVGGDLKSSYINYTYENADYNAAENVAIGPDRHQYKALEGTGPKVFDQDQLKELNDTGAESDGQDTQQILVKQDLEHQEDGREMGDTTVKELAETGRDVHDKEKLTGQGYIRPHDKQEKGDWSFIGMRVVRGPDWQRGDEDGGCGCVGTVVPVQGAESKSSIWVRWDSGVLAEYRSGREGGQFDLRIYDNAQRGVQHPSIDCDGCLERGVVGIRWKCLRCANYNLCYSCYNEGKHERRHPFMRIDEPGVPGVEVPCRSGAKRFTAFGIFSGAQVVQGPDWKFQGHEEQTVGTVTKVESYEVPESSRSSYRSLVKVRWPWGSSNYYRRGFEGQMDLQYFKKASNGEFFIEHLPTLDATTCSPWYAIGDKVRLRNIDLGELKDMQDEQYGWIEKMKNFRGRVGEVRKVNSKGDLRVKFGRSLFYYNVRCLQRKTPEDYIVGGRCCVADGNVLIKSAISGNASEVKQILAISHIMASYQNEQGVTALHLAANLGHLDVVIALVEGNAPLEQQDTCGDTALMFAVVGNKLDVVQYLLLVGSNPNTFEEHGVTPLHLAAGHTNNKCAQALLSSPVQQCDTNSQDIDGDTPLSIAIGRPWNNDAMIDLLLEHTTDDGLRLMNHTGFNSLHFAASHDKKYAVEKILKRSPSMINIAKHDGYTALHIAAINGYTEIVKTLLKQGNCDISARTLKGQTARDLAVEASHQECVDILDAHEGALKD